MCVVKGVKKQGLSGYRFGGHSPCVNILQGSIDLNSATSCQVSFGVIRNQAEKFLVFVKCHFWNCRLTYAVFVNRIFSEVPSEFFIPV